ncbi:MAG: molybdenum ABC transporter ATP-binding protein [Parvibaculaceae bacterium]
MIGVDIAVARSEFTLEAQFTAGAGITALFGESGSGKSTLLNAIAGLVRPERGRIVMDEIVFLDTARGIHLPPHKRRIGYVFQDALLFPHLNVERNLRYGQWFRAETKRPQQFGEIVDLLGIGGLLARRPVTLSGGERQRVAIGRALMTEPRLLLMDEPLASLDMDRKREIMPYIEKLRDELGLPIILVSHAVDEVARLADQVIMLKRGQIEAQGTPAEVLRPSPLSSEDRFSGVSVLMAEARRYDEKYQLTEARHPAGTITLPGRIGRKGERLRIVIRATDVTLAASKPRELSIRTVLDGRISTIGESKGPVVMVDVTLEGGDRLTAAVTCKAIDELGLDSGDQIFCLIKSVSIDERLLAEAPPPSP